MKNQKLLLICITISISYFLSVTAWGNESEKETSKPERAETVEFSKPQFNITDILYSDTKELNSSIAVRKEHGRIYLIIEVDHNFIRNEFVLRPTDAGIMNMTGIQVIKDNLKFGFNNKFVALLPIIEVPPQENSPRANHIYSLDSTENRTQQQIDVTDVIRQAADRNMLADAEGKAYRVAEISELAFVLMVNEKGRPKVMESLRVDVENLKDGETRKLYGDIEVTRIPIEVPSETKTVKPKLSLEVIQRYFQPFLIELQQGYLELDRREKIQRALEAIPFEIEKGRIAELTNEINRAETPTEILHLIMREQVKTQMEMESRSCAKVYR